MKMAYLPDQTLKHLRQVVGLPDLSETPYQLGQELGRGGMAVVYEAWDTRLERHVALKIIDTLGDATGGDGDALEEAKTLAKLEHPGIVPIYDAGCLRDGRFYCAMRLIQGRRLDAFIAHEKSQFERIRVFQKICDAVGFAHSCGVVHRDLKPQNIMVGKFGEVFVIDWGVAEWLIATGRRRSGVIAGTRQYMAPEQAGGRPDAVDGRADVYSLGVVLKDIIGEEGSRSLAAIANKALAQDPDDRYQHVEDLAADLTRFLDCLPITAYDETPIERARRFAARNRVLLLLLATYAFVRIALFILSRV
jgi:hypothetical protein